MSVQGEINRINTEVTGQADLVAQIKSALEGKAGRVAEEWVLTLEDNSTVTKVVYVG